MAFVFLDPMDNAMPKRQRDAHMPLKFLYLRWLLFRLKESAHASRTFIWLQ